MNEFTGRLLNGQNYQRYRKSGGVCRKWSDIELHPGHDKVAAADADIAQRVSEEQTAVQHYVYEANNEYYVLRHMQHKRPSPAVRAGRDDAVDKQPEHEPTNRGNGSVDIGRQRFLCARGAFRLIGAGSKNENNWR